VVPVDDCLIAHSLVAEILADGWFADAAEVTVRVGERTGDRLVVVDPTATGVRLPDGVRAVGADELAAGRDAYFHEEVGGRRFRIGARSFFQCRPDGAETLVELVGAALGPLDGHLVDAYCGVGLFALLLGDGRPVTGIESNRSSVADARINLQRPDGAPSARVIRSRVERWRSEPAVAVVADPARAGLRRPGAEVVARTGARVVVLVSCDPAALARDARLLTGLGYRLDRVITIDLFGQTSHVETISRFVLQ
jgi:23S rRNA (uracil1939-C5)-methyltransferase